MGAVEGPLISVGPRAERGSISILKSPCCCCLCVRAPSHSNGKCSACRCCWSTHPSSLCMRIYLRSALKPTDIGGPSTAPMIPRSAQDDMHFLGACAECERAPGGAFVRAIALRNWGASRRWFVRSRPMTFKPPAPHPHPSGWRTAAPWPGAVRRLQTRRRATPPLRQRRRYGLMKILPVEGSWTLAPRGMPRTSMRLYG